MGTVANQHAIPNFRIARDPGAIWIKHMYDMATLTDSEVNQLRQELWPV